MLIQVKGKRSSYPRNLTFEKFASPTNKTCYFCRAAGRPHPGHDISTCWHITKFEKLEISKA